MAFDGPGNFFDRPSLESPREVDPARARREAAEQAERYRAEQQERLAQQQVERDRVAEQERIKEERLEHRRLEEERKAEQERRESAEREKNFEAIDDRYSRRYLEQTDAIKDALEAAMELDGERRASKLEDIEQKVEDAHALRAEHVAELLREAKDASEVDDRITGLRDQSRETEEGMRQNLDEQYREVRIDRDRAERIDNSRPPGLVDQFTQSLTQQLAARVIQFIAARAIDHVAPGLGAPAVHVFTIGKKIYDTISQLDKADGITVAVPMVSEGILELDFVVDINDKEPGEKLPLHLRSTAKLTSPVAAWPPQIGLHEPQEPDGVAPSSDVPEDEPASDVPESKPASNVPESEQETPKPPEEPDETELAQVKELRCVTESLMSALDDIQRFQPDDLKVLKTSVSMNGQGMFVLGTTAASDQLNLDNNILGQRSVFDAGNGHFGSGLGAGVPGPGAVAEPGRLADQAVPGQAVPQSGFPGGRPSAYRRTAPENQIAAIVIWGSASMVMSATGSRVIDGNVLLTLVRKELFRTLYDRDPRSVAPLMRALRGLELVVFLDPSLDGGLWIDVDPATEAPAATLLIEMEATPGELGTVRFYRSQ